MSFQVRISITRNVWLMDIIFKSYLCIAFYSLSRIDCVIKYNVERILMCRTKNYFKKSTIKLNNYFLLLIFFVSIHTYSIFVLLFLGFLIWHSKQKLYENINEKIKFLSCSCANWYGLWILWEIFFNRIDWYNRLTVI